MLILDRIETSIADKSMLICRFTEESEHVLCLYDDNLQQIRRQVSGWSDSGQNILPGSVSSSFLYLAQ